MDEVWLTVSKVAFTASAGLKRKLELARDLSRRCRVRRAAPTLALA